MNFEHIPVLCQEAIDGLAIKPNGKYIDATFGRGGHSQVILQCLGSDGWLLALDRDPEAMKIAKKGPFFDDPRFCFAAANFSELSALVQERGLLNQIDGILLDVGVSSPQLDDASRGFSFAKDGPLDMRMNPDQGIPASTWVNQASDTEIIKVLREYGEERFARRIASAILEARAESPIISTQQLSGIVFRAVPVHEKHKHPATRTFQAIRIFINRELGELEDCLQQSIETLAVGGRLCVISFHSLEDRIAKQFIKKQSEGEPLPRGLPVMEKDIKRRLKKVGGLIRPTAEEVKENVRARSARLRIAEKIG